MPYMYLKRGSLLLVFMIITLAGFAQSHNSLFNNEPENQIKIGLALSGGGAKGFAHIGVLKVFEEENIPVHMVAGTSMGAVVGALYAAGYSPGQIRDVALRTDWIKLFDDNYQFRPRDFSTSVSSRDTYLLTFPLHEYRLQLPAALTDGQNISMMLYRLLLPYHDTEDFSALPIPFVCVATDLSTGEARVFREGYLPDAVRASIAIPTVFKPVSIDGKSYIDGGIARNIPVQDVKALGADVVIASDVGNPVQPVDSLQSFVHILRQAVGFRQQESDRRQIEMADFYLRPDIEAYSSFSYEKVKELIALGEEAAREAVPTIKKFLENNQTTAPVEKSYTASEEDTLLISDLYFTNIDGVMARQAGLSLGMDFPSRMTISDIESRVKRIYNSGLFSHVSYRLHDSPEKAGKTMAMTFQPRGQDFGGFSMRYDSRYKAALLFEASLSDNLFWNDRLSGRLRVGDVLDFTAGYSTPITLAPLSRFHLELGMRRSPIDFYEDGEALSTFGLEQLNLGSFLSLNVLHDLQVKTGLEAEFFNLNEAVGNTLILENTRFLLKGTGELNFSTLNRPYFPTQGQRLGLKSTVSSDLWGSSVNFVQISGSWLGTMRLGPGLNLTGNLLAGYSSTSSLPLHYNFFLGGITDNPVFIWNQFAFMGYDTQQLRSPNLAALQTELQFRIAEETYLTAGWNVAHLSDQWTFNIRESRLRNGFSLSAGTLTLIGPVELSLSSPHPRGGYTVKINVGYRF